MKTIPVQLLAHKAQAATTLTDLLLVGPLDDDTFRGLTLLDIDVTYSDAGGELPSWRTGGSVTYKARTGFQMSAMQSSADLGVDNAEGKSLKPVAGFEIEGFTQAEIDSGALDKINFVAYRVNYNDLTAGRHEIISAGTIGEVRTKVGGLTVLELRSLSQQLRQTIVELDSVFCRAQFGSQPIGTGGGVVEERFPCGFDFSSLWVSGSVTTAGAEPDLSFIDSTLIGLADADEYAPGVVKATSGANTGIEREVESYNPTTGEITLQIPFPNAMAVDDEYDLRPDCTHDPDGCRRFWDTDWVDHYRGEPNIPVGDSGLLNAPGAAIVTSIGSTGE